MPQTIIENTPVSVVGADREFAVQALTCSGFAMTPAAGNVGGFPLEAFWNDDTTTTFTIRGPQFIVGNISSDKLTVLTEGGGGQPGDKWYITLMPSMGTREIPRVRTDAAGRLAVAPPGAQELFDIHSALNPEAFATSFGAENAAIAYVSPKDKRTISSELTYWDLSQFSHVLFVLEQGTGTPLDWSLKLSVELSYGTVGLELETLTAGTLNEFGNPAETPTDEMWNGTSPGFVLAGAATDEATAFSRYTRKFLPYARFKFEWSQTSTTQWGTVFNTSHYLRTRAIAW